MNKIEEKINNNQNTIEIKDNDMKNSEYSEERGQLRKYKRIIYFLITLILIIIILYIFLVAKLGRIGYRYGDIKQVNAQFDNLSIINISGDNNNNLKNTVLDIFSNEKEEDKKLIAPNSKGSFKFCIQNVTDYDINYDIMFSDIMKEKINMKYRLKIDNIYIRGSENEYVDLNKLNLSDVKVLKNSNNVFTLDWYWEETSDEEDTRIGSSENDIYYTLKLSVIASRIGK